MSDETIETIETIETTPATTSEPTWSDSFDLLAEDRKQELANRLWNWTPDQATRQHPGPFAREYLTGLDVYWLAACTLAGSDGDSAAAAPQLANWSETSLSDLHLERTLLAGAHLKGAILRGAHLEGAILVDAHLEGAHLREAHLEHADLRGANLRLANVTAAHLELADLGMALLERASLADAHLEQARLSRARLHRATLLRAHLEEADLHWAHLEGANLEGAYLANAYIRGAHLNSATQLSGAYLTLDRQGWARLRWQLRRRVPGSQPEAPALGDINWAGVGAVDLTQIADWDDVDRLGDERWVTWQTGAQHIGLARAYRQVATQLRAQGMTEVADRFSYRALIWERHASLRRGRIPQYLGSWLLAILAGYGYRPLFTILWYLVVIVWSAVAYQHFGPSEGVPFSPLGALVFSVTSFHGRGFFPGSTDARHSLLLDDPITVLAAAEAVVGLLIEISFIATFTQRFFGSK